MGVPKALGDRASLRAPSTALRAVHELFVAGRVDPSYLDTTPIRPVVAESWRRSLAKGVDPDGEGASSSSVTLRLARMRDAHPLASALPVIRKLLVDDAADSGVVVAVTSADGTLLWVEGDPEACRKAESMNFVPGADWSERHVGTNAPGTALALDRELQIRSSEHFARVAQPWNCTAAPVHDPATGVLLGAIDLTGGPEVASGQALALVRATAVAVENHLALLRLTEPRAHARAETSAHLRVLGAHRPRWQFTDESGERRITALTPRHADILVLLTQHPEGLSADHLAMMLDDKDLDVVTVRAEMSRLRRVIEPVVVGSRPYRLLHPVDSDVSEVFAAMRAGDVGSALSAYTGALLPQSMSPAIARLRTELGTSLRTAVIASGDLGLLSRWLELPEGRDDRAGWRLLHDGAGAGSIGQAQARGHLAGLDLDLA
ncbi:transcriptional regulator [Mycolicibacterium madagascariense]|uniref:Transcriptional regulator n=1 Tax=Mycolicibacterium madagascariense TaxID=212765 RepID=A0A7I7XAY9_9MYCO|nr:GAF domain-containing protein [Mycolicibacterium madagascariense]MCV7013493.1 GAF domain-containing protein [Mycolicibacterium madagascariense]BBZ26939.1 transcriptional regulator [Mycolicibacterium madagascariense]